MVSPTARPYRCVVFDLDGTVVNTIPLIIASYDHALWQVLQTRPDPDEARSWIGQTLYATFSRLYPGHADALIDAYVEFNLAHMDDLVERIPGMPELIADLTAAGIAIGIATSKRRHSAEVTLRAAGLDGAIPVTVAMEDTSLHKPDPAPLLLALERLGFAPSDSAYVGDAVVDVKAAQAAGMDAIAVTWGAGLADQLAAAGPVAVAASVAELGSFVRP